MKFDNLYKEIISIISEAPLKHPNQKVLDVAAPKGHLTGADFKKLRSMKKEETGQLGELSKPTLASYVKKAAWDASDKSNDSAYYSGAAGRMDNSRGQADRMKTISNELKDKANKRLSGVNKAVNKMSERSDDYTLEDFTLEELEEFMQSEEAGQLDELSYDTLNSYMKGRRKQIDRSARAGVSTGTGSASSEKLEKNIRGYRKAWAKRDMKEDTDLEESVQETIIYHNNFQIQLKDSYSFGDYLMAAKKIVGDDDAIDYANQAFSSQDTDIFVEEYSQSAVEDRVKGHMAAGHKVSMPKYSMKGGKPHAEYVVTDKESGVRRKYIHHGNVTKMENMGARGKRDEK
jgi:hypothetical protein